MSLTDEQRQCLLALAKQSIQHGLATGEPISVDLSALPPDLQELRATFVTLEHRRQLRGCIGMLEAIRPLAEDVAHNAFAAAFKDSRFTPLSAPELDDLSIHISILSPAQAISFNSEQDLLNQIQPGVDGLILKEGSKRGTFLPSVWEKVSKPEEFLRHLKQKAGLPPDYWSETIQVLRYRTEMVE